MTSATLHELAEEHFAASLAASPFSATQLGIVGFDAEVPDVTDDAQGRRAEQLMQFGERAQRVDDEALDEADRVTRSMLLADVETSVSRLRSGILDLAVSGPLAVQTTVLGSMPKVLLGSTAAAADYVTRCTRLPVYLDATADRIACAARAGRTPTQRSVVRALAEIDAYLRMPLSDDPIVHPAGRFSPVAAEQVGDAVTAHVRPAFQRLRDVLAGVVAPLARDDEHCGLVHVPGGEQMYQAALTEHATLPLAPVTIHDIGLDLCGQLSAELVERGAAAFGGGSDSAALRERLRTDPSLRYADRTEIVTDARGALQRAADALPSWFTVGDLPPCDVEEMNAVEAQYGVLGYYQPPSADGGRPGRHWINTSEPGSRTRYEYEALAFHESLPGHHLQLSRAQALQDLPRFRRFSYVAAYSEGWGLYAERLADEMGLYSGDLARLGMVTFDAWRAARLVVDTGMHALGWSRGRAVGFLRDTTALTPGNVVNEIDRYIDWPGQATSYMLGRLEIDRLRRRFEQVRAGAFDIKELHDVLLRGGAVPLPTLAAQVERAMVAA